MNVTVTLNDYYTLQSFIDFQITSPRRGRSRMYTAAQSLQATITCFTYSALLLIDCFKYNMTNI